MSRQNNVRGPTSALTEFLRESGITHDFIQRRTRTRQNEEGAEQTPGTSQAGPSNANADGDIEMADGTAGASPTRQNNGEDEAMNSDNMDGPEPSTRTTGKRKASKKALDKLKAAEKAKAKKKGEIDTDDNDSDDEYKAPSKSLKINATPSVRPPVGTLEVCAKCEKEFSVTRYTVAAVPPPGFLCYTCTKKAGIDPHKKPAAAPRRRKLPEEKRKIVNFEEKQFPTLASLCIKIIGKFIEDIEALGDIGSVNLHEIGKVLAKNRSLTPSNCTLLYDMGNTELKLMDVTELTPDAFCAMASLNPAIESLRLDYCGCIDDIAIKHWAQRFPNLTRLELLGPFLVRVEAWMVFFVSHPQLTGFLITQSPRFDLACMESLSNNCKELTELRLSEIGKMGDEFLPHIATFKDLQSLEITSPTESLTSSAVVDLLSTVGPKLTHLNLSNNELLDDTFINEGLLPHTSSLTSLVLEELPDITDETVANFFENTTNAPMTHMSFKRCQSLSDKALKSLVSHSATKIVNLNINSWRETSDEALNEIAKLKELKVLDISWCRQVDDFVIKQIIEGCENITSISCFACNKLTSDCPRRSGVSLHGVEGYSA